MAPKRKAAGDVQEKQVKKTNQNKTKDTLPKGESDPNIKNKAGKKIPRKQGKNLAVAQVKIEPPSPERVDSEQKINNGTFAIFELNQLLQKKTKLNFQGSISWKVFLFPSLAKANLLAKKTHQYFGLDLVEEGTERTYWTHKASVWQDLFISVKELAKTGQVMNISAMFNGVLSCPVRAVPNGPNEIQTFQSGKGQKIQHWIMLVPMPSDIDATCYVQEFLSSFQVLCKKPFIRSAYKSGVVGITQHPGLINQISEDGNYWYILDNAGQKDVIIKANSCLSEVLLDQQIKEVVSKMLGTNNNPNTWTDAVKAYAFGK